ncbi:MAG TPA: hypothetical protein PK961_04925 [bacterium]|nr:hypothetical protein [bacterium]
MKALLATLIVVALFAMGCGDESGNDDDSHNGTVLTAEGYCEVLIDCYRDDLTVDECLNTWTEEELTEHPKAKSCWEYRYNCDDWIECNGWS